MAHLSQPRSRKLTAAALASGRRQIKYDWRIVKIDQLSLCDGTWIANKQITSCGVYYLIDASLHVHICSFTPSLEAFPVQAFAEFTTHEAADADEGEVEREMLVNEQSVSYFDVSVMERHPSILASKMIPDLEREEDETDQAYRCRFADYVHECLCGNPVSF